jgi:hypothetical protein
MVFIVDDEQIIRVSVSNGGIVATDYTADLVSNGEEIAPILFPVTTCDDVLVASVDTATGGEMRAIDTVTGRRLWSQPAPGYEGPDGDGVSPLACTTGVVVAQGENEVVGLDAQSGQPKWRAALDPDDPPFAAGDLVVIGTYDGVVGLDATTGRELWRLAGGADFVGSLSTVGVTLGLASSLQVVSLDGEVMGEIAEETLESLVDDGRVSQEDVELAGRSDQPVLVVPGADRYLTLAGELVDLPAPPGGTVEALGVSDDLIWVQRVAPRPDGESIATMALVDVDGQVVAEVEIDAPWSTSVAAPNLVLGRDGAVTVASPTL